MRYPGLAFLEVTRTPSVIEERLARVIREQLGRQTPASERRSWSQSLPVLAEDLQAAGLSNVEVLLEYRLPLTSKRADVVLAGVHPRTGAPSYVVVELKQWSDAIPFDETGELVSLPGFEEHPRLHPVCQVRNYCEYLRDFTVVLHDHPDAVAGAAYLHNAGRLAWEHLGGYPQTVEGRLFTGADRSDFHAFLLSRLAPDVSSGGSADLLLRSAISPSRQLLSVASAEIAGREQFVLLDEQKIAVDTVLHAVERSRQANHKSVVIVTGGPGSGKSVIALSLLGELAKRGRTALHATGSRSFTRTLRKVVGARAQQMFKYFNSFTDAEQNGIDVLVLDEAHRIRQTSESRWTRAAQRTGRAQVDELLSAARVPVFLLDQHQVVRPGEMGTVEQIRTAAQQIGLDVYEVGLDAQFRCGGSERYLRWVERLLGLVDGGPMTWSEDPPFQLDVVDSPEELESRLGAFQGSGYTARMTAGYCWKWSDPRKDGSLVPDVSIGLWSRPWNLRGDRAVGDAPPAALWATDTRGFGQVGCVYTAQGFEYDWNGVIFGPDLVWRDNHWVSRRPFNKDPDFATAKKVTDAEFDRLVRHVYKVLLTRGMVGTLLFSVDPETNDFLRSQAR